MISLRSLLVGDNSFIGVSHLSQARARSRAQELDIDAIVRVVYSAIEHGATGFTFSTHPTNLQVLEYMKLNPGPKFQLYPVLPYAQGYVRTANEKGTMKLATELFSKLAPSTKVSSLLQGGLSAITLDPIRMLKSYVDIELGSYLRVKPENTDLGAILLHDILTDLGVAFEAVHFFEAFIDNIRKRYTAKPGFVTRNFVKFVDLFERNRLPLRDIVIMCPFNKVGFQMTPTKESCEECLSKSDLGEIFAMSILAGGYIPLDEAIDYIRTLQNLTGVVAGVSTQQHAQETFTSLKPLLTPR